MGTSWYLDLLLIMLHMDTSVFITKENATVKIKEHVLFHVLV